MRYSEIIEGIRMGARDLSQPTKKRYSIGFEFEVAVKDGHPDASSEDIDDGIDDARERFENQWHNGNSTFDFEEWFNDEVRLDNIKLIDLISKQKYKPKYGWVESAEDYLKSHNEEVQERWDNEYYQYDKDFLKKATEYYREYEKNSDKILKDRDRINEIITLFQRHRFEKGRNMSQEEFDKAIKVALEKTSDERAVKFLEQNMDFIELYVEGPSLLTKDSEDFDFDPDDKEYFYDENKKIISLNDSISISTMDELIEYFKVTKEKLRDALVDDWGEAEDRLMDNEFDEWYNTNYRSYGGGTSRLDYVRSKVYSKLGRWEVKPDGTAGVDAEIVPIPHAKNIELGIKTMRDVFEFIEEDEYIYTAQPTGLHINIGTFSRDEIEEIDWLKFLIIYRADRVLAEFNRMQNHFAPDRLKEIITNLENNNYAELHKNVMSNNDIVLDRSEKYSSINLSKLKMYGIIELRAPGNAGYEKKGDYLEKEIRRIVRALDIASNPEAYKKEYIKKLYQMVGVTKDDSNDSYSNPVDAFFSKVSDIHNPKSSSPMIDKIIEIMGYPQYFNSEVANKQYTLKVHNEIMSELRKDADDNYGRMMYHLRFDKNDVVKNSKFIRLLFAALKQLKTNDDVNAS